MKSVGRTLKFWLDEPFIKMRYVTAVFLIGFGAGLGVVALITRLPELGWWRIPIILGLVAMTLPTIYRLVKVSLADAFRTRERIIREASGIDPRCWGVFPATTGHEPWKERRKR